MTLNPWNSNMVTECIYEYILVYASLLLLGDEFYYLSNPTAYIRTM